jgi:hypothetical protein
MRRVSPKPIDPCIECGETTVAFIDAAHLKYVGIDRTPADGGWLCGACGGYECDECGKPIGVDEEVRVGVDRPTNFHDTCHDPEKHGKAEYGA